MALIRLTLKSADTAIAQETSDHGSQFLPLPLRHPYGEHKPNSQGGHKHDESSRLSKEKIVKFIKIKAAQLSKLMR